MSMEKETLFDPSLTLAVSVVPENGALGFGGGRCAGEREAMHAPLARHPVPRGLKRLLVSTKSA